MKSVYKQVYLPNFFALQRTLFSSKMLDRDKELGLRRLFISELKDDKMTEEAYQEFSLIFSNYIWFERYRFLGYFGVEQDHDFSTPEKLRWKV